jgi:hypothetical protein
MLMFPVQSPLKRHLFALFAGALIATVLLPALTLRGGAAPAPGAVAMFRERCFACHNGKSAAAGINLEALTSPPAVGEAFQQWEKVTAVLTERRMPPKGLPQPSEEQRTGALTWIDTQLKSYIAAHEGDPGRVTVRRLTSGEYAYSIQDLTGLDIRTGVDPSSDAVGGEGFSNFGDVQFMQDANLERYLQAAKLVADHAVLGAGPLEFFADPGKTGFELSAIDRIRQIYSKYGFRTVSGEGGRPYGLDKYGRALYAAWHYRHRAALGEARLTLAQLAQREGLAARLTQHIWTVMNNPGLGFPSSEISARWQKMSPPGPDRGASTDRARREAEAIQQFLVTWPSWLFARGDLAAGGAGDESPLEFSPRTLKASPTHRLTFFRGGRPMGGGRFAPPPPGNVRLYVQVAPINPKATGDQVVIWRNPTVGIRPFNPRPLPPKPAATPATAAASANTSAGGIERRGFLPPGPREPLRKLLGEAESRRLNFGVSLDGTPVGPNDFVTTSSLSFEIPVPEGAFTVDFQVDAELGANRSHVFRLMISDREDGSTPRGRPTWGLLGDMNSAGYKQFYGGVMEFASILPPNSHGEPTPADKDPIPEPFDNTYNVPEHDEFVVKVKYLREDRFVMANLLDAPERTRLNQAWNDLKASFEYHDNYLRLLAAKFGFDLKGKGVAQMDAAGLGALPEAMRPYVVPLRKDWEQVMAAQKSGEAGHFNDCLEFASRAWRRPLTEREKTSLRAFYVQALAGEGEHRKAIRALIARILVSPAFLYRVEPAALTTTAAASSPFTSREMAGRLSYFLWSSIPDDELRRAAAAGELSSPAGISRQVKRMLADPKARRFAVEFFGQWLGFYHFDEYKGVDTGRFPEFTSEVKSAMYDEAVSFFEYIVRQDRPARELVFADYTFLNQALAKHYGVQKEVAAQMQRVEGAGEFHRGGLVRLGAVLTATSAPLRTSPVKRGDWLLRRVIGTPVPPPPANAGTLPADDKNFGGMTIKQRLAAHKRNATCAGCHTRIDPLGFPLERYDSVGRWRSQYADGKPIEDSDQLADRTTVQGVDGLLAYLKDREPQIRRTLSYKMAGYALGRTIQASDLPLIARMVDAGPEATLARLVTEIATSRQFRQRPRPVKEKPVTSPGAKSARVSRTAQVRIGD